MGGSLWWVRGWRCHGQFVRDGPGAVAMATPAPRPWVAAGPGPSGRAPVLPHNRRARCRCCRLCPSPFPPPRPNFPWEGRAVSRMAGPGCCPAGRAELIGIARLGLLTARCFRGLCRSHRRCCVQPGAKTHLGQSTLDYRQQIIIVSHCKLSKCLTLLPVLSLHSACPVPVGLSRFCCAAAAPCPFCVIC